MDRGSSIDVSKKKGRRITESALETVAALKQNLLMVIPCMEEFLNTSDSQHLQSCQSVLSRVDDNFSQLYQEIHQIENAKAVFARFKDKQDRIYKFIKQVIIMLPCDIYRYKPLSKESYYEIQFTYKKLFIVRLVIKDKTSFFKAKDVAFYSMSEMNFGVYSSDTKHFTLEMSQYDLYRQMTFAAKRFIQYTNTKNNPNALELIKWINNYDDFLEATCVLCHSHLSLSGNDIFSVPARRHFETGMPYHSACCKGENLLNTLNVC